MAVPKTQGPLGTLSSGIPFPWLFFGFFPVVHFISTVAKQAVEFDKWIFGPEQFPGLSRNGSQLPVSLIAHLVEQCNSIARSWVRAPTSDGFFPSFLSSRLLLFAASLQ